MAVSDEVKEEYQKLLTEYCESNSSDPIPNRLPFQAELAVHTLLESAVKQQEQGKEPVAVCILTSTLPDYIYGGRVTIALKKFKNAGGKIRVLVWNDDLREIDDTFWKSLQRDTESFRLSNTKKHGEELNHLLLVGNKSYRLEAPHPYHGASAFSDSSPAVSARINFNDQVLGDRIAKVFDGCWDLCSPIAWSHSSERATV